MKTKVLFFGPLAELAGLSEVEVAGFADTQSLQQEILRRFPQLEGRRYALALNRQMVRGATPLAEGSTLAFLPPFSGG